ncbi:IS110 family transposase [Tepiditoga spiralis]|uniref:IS110 family transposase n=1 Tax=Tepiditoga spiralis TaxID=2108365 RepID=A0A7G1G4F2_9BACT|nr:IS110 family transposase [Tepiditoga spiralis]BBE29894.1 IS110 family transposase [Tepiditoga spiralis]
MNYTQNEKIKQVDEKTLVVGVDIAKETHYARTFDNRGIEYGKVIKFKSNRDGFEAFKKQIKEIAEITGREKIIIGIEPTGHYWYTLANYVNKRGMKLVQVNPYHVKRAKELDDNTPSKSDRKDPKTIAMLVKDGRYAIPYMPEGIYAEIRKAYDIRETINKKLLVVKNRIQRWVAIYFPEYKTVFKGIYGKASIITLEELSIPIEIIKLSAEEIVEIWQKEIKRAVGIKRAKSLIEAAKETTGLTNGLEMAKYEIKKLIQEYKMLEEEKAELEEKLKRKVYKISGVEKALSIKGIGIITISGFIAEVGEIKRFDHAKQIIKLAGLNLRENSSGKHKGETKISKRGRKRLRSLLFKSILPLVAQNKEFKLLHRYYTTRKTNPLKKKQSLVALMGKLIRIIYTLMTKKKEYDPEKLLKDIKGPKRQSFLAA